MCYSQVTGSYKSEIHPMRKRKSRMIFKWLISHNALASLKKVLISCLNNLLKGVKVIPEKVATYLVDRIRYVLGSGFDGKVFDPLCSAALKSSYQESVL